MVAREDGSPCFRVRSNQSFDDFNAQLAQFGIHEIQRGRLRQSARIANKAHELVGLRFLLRVHKALQVVGEPALTRKRCEFESLPCQLGGEAAALAPVGKGAIAGTVLRASR